MITELIDKQDSFEIIGDKIAQILVVEVAEQMVLATAGGKDPDGWKLRIYRERANPREAWLNNQDDESPIVNIWFDTDSTDESSSNVMQRQAMNGVFNIDCYGLGKSSDDGATGHIAGDKAAALESHRALRLVRNIMMSAAYTYLDLRGLVGWRRVTSRTAFQPTSGSQPAQHVQCTRLTLSVRYNEFSPQVHEEILELVTVQMKQKEDGQVILEMDFDYTTP